MRKWACDNYRGSKWARFNLNLYTKYVSIVMIFIKEIQLVFYREVLINKNTGPPLWSSGQSLWLQIQRSRVRFPALVVWVVVGLERGPLSLVRSIEELLESKEIAAPRLENRLTAVGFRCADHVTPLYLQKLALTSPTGGGRSVGIVRSRTKATELIRTQSNTCLCSGQSVDSCYACVCEWSCRVLQMNLQRTKITSRTRN
jgi:hypothetical protein